MDLHVYVHLVDVGALSAKLDQILALITAQGAATMAELDSLKTQVEQTTTVEQSAITLLNGLSAQISALKQNPGELQALADQLSAKSSELATAIAANTPAA